MTRVNLSGDQFVLFIQLFRMGIMASVSGVLITSSFFKKLIFLDERTAKQNWQMALIFGSLLTAGTAVRVLAGYEGVDLSLSGTFLVGLIGGITPGASVGFFVGIPGMLGGEWATIPFTVLCGFLGGMVRRKALRHGELWDFSPFPFSNVVRSARALRRQGVFDSRAVIFGTVILLEAVRTFLSERMAPAPLFAFRTDHFWVTLCVWLTTLACVGIPLKIWNNTRVETMLDEQRSAAMRARFDALRSQMNPHFLFNTLNAATSLVWNDPEKARFILVKLSFILRRLLRDSEDFTPLSREIEFVEDYLSLERARFGDDKIQFTKEIDPRSLDVPVPAMVLQPLVENAVRHGLSRRVGGGRITIRTECNGAALEVVVTDDGEGFSGAPGGGIGLANVRERLSVAYGPAGRFDIDSTPGAGTTVRIEVPVKRRSGSA
ncbi:MAG TPA: sensor histidine kinase [Candidatus Eisenbacteria bacterium]|uniref:histidine kinase n=1 Tax=Eiseniibacteriota bacterium TaxID=2212470 RepID=A0A7V2AW49_UNCEI|nr:sensor histidine kinase [Candidatus Eisenbacteria bacterium]